VIANSFDNGERPAIADGEPLAGGATQEHRTASGAVKDGVACDNVSGARLFVARANADRAPVHPLTRVIVRLASQLNLNTRDEERSQALAGGAFQVENDRAIWQASIAESRRDFTRQGAADGAIDVADVRSNDERPPEIGWDANGINTRLR
jgi:hypothetical protein